MTFHSKPRIPEVGDSPSKLRVCFDIETGPEPLGRVKEMLPPVKVPATYKKEEAIEAYRKKASKDAIAKAPLDATTGRVLAIGYIFSDDDEVYVIADMDEKSLLEAFWEQYRPLFSAHWIGFNSNSFDWPFIVRRSMRYGLTLPMEFYQPIKWQKTLVDLMELWACGKEGCKVVMDCRDDPAGYNGPMPHTKCLGKLGSWHNHTNPSDGLVRRTIRKLKKMFSLRRADHA